MAMWAVGWTRRRKDIARPFLAFTTGMVVWTLAYLWELEADTEGAMLWASKVQYIGVTTIPVSVLWFTAIFTGRPGWITKESAGLALLVPLVALGLVWTNDVHGLIWREVGATYGNRWSLLVVTYGGAFWAFVVYSYTCLITALILVADMALRTVGVWRRQAMYVLLGLLAPWFANFLRVGGLSPFEPLDPTPFAFAFAGMAMAVAILNVDLLVLAPVAREQVLDAVSEGIVVVDPAGRVVDMNRAAALILQVDPSTSVGSSALEVLGRIGEVLESKADTVQVSLSAPGVPESVYNCARFHVTDGTGRSVASTVVISNITSLILAQREIEDAQKDLERRIEERTLELRRSNERLRREMRQRRQAEQQEQAMEAQLRQSQKLETIGTLAGGIAHDFNNLLAAILGFTELAEDEAHDAAKVRQYLAQVTSAATRAQEVVGKILTFSRQAEHSWQPVDLSRFVDDSMPLIRALLPSTVRFSVELDPTTPTVMGDATQLQQVLMNLCTNAAQSMPNGGTLSISVRRTHEPPTRSAPSLATGVEGTEWVALGVSDSGAGIPEEVRRRIFDPFFTTKSVGHGTGLGLSVVHGIVTSHGGEITVESEPGHGTAFTVFLPVSEQLPIVAADPVADPPPGGHESILVVDDEVPLTALCRRVLEGRGYAVTTCNHPDEAFEVFAAAPDDFDLLLTDQTMPDQTGVDLAQRILRSRPGLPVVIMTGLAQSASADDLSQLGVKQILLKPVRTADLLRQVRAALDS